VRLRLEGGDLVLRRGAKVIVRMDTKTLEVRA
jgi:hypothetical protein